MTRWKIIVAAVLMLFLATGASLAVTGVLPYRVYVVHTGSMTPTIPSTSAVLVRTGTYHVGQAISFDEQGGVITHRLVRISADGTITTKGDANATNDPWHPRTTAIIGGVVASAPTVGYWLFFLRNPLGLACIFLGALVCWQLWALTNTDTDTPDVAPSNRGQSRHSPTKRRHRHARNRPASSAEVALPIRHRQ